MPRLRLDRDRTVMVLLAVLFAIAHEQLPLYSSNQNTYFLHGLAWAHQGELARDWLAHTTTPVPVFSAYVAAVAWLGIPVLFHLAHVGVLGLYAYCLLWLVRLIRPDIRTMSLAVATALLIPLHPGIITRGLAGSGVSVFVGLATGFRHVTEGVAGQPLMRSFHQPSAFGVGLVLAVCLLATGRRRAATITGAAVTWVHAAYFLPAALLTGVIVARELWAKRWREAVLLAGLALLVALPPAAHILDSFAPTSPAIAAEAARILVHERFPHHADIHTWFGFWTVLQVLWAIAGLVAAWPNRTIFACFATWLTAACLLTLLQFVSGSDGLALLLPWRMFALLVPTATAILVARGAQTLTRAPWADGWAGRMATVALPVLVAGGLLNTATRFWTKQPDLVRHVASRCGPTDTYLVPPSWSDFRLDTACPIFVDWKSHPFRDQEVLEWYGRVQAARAFFAAPNAAEATAALAQVRALGDVTHTVVRRDRLQRFRKLGRVAYQDDEYAILDLHRGTESE